MNDLDFLVAGVEWTWTLLAVVGVVVCAWALVDGYIDRHEMRAAIKEALLLGQPTPNHGAVQVVQMNLRSAHASAVLHVFFLGLGGLALAIPDDHFSPIVFVLGCGYITVAATNVRAIFLNQLDRVLIRRNAGK